MVGRYHWRASVPYPASPNDAGAPMLGEIPRLVERQTIERTHERRFNRLHVIVEAIDGDATLVMKRRDERGRRVQRVGDAAAVPARVQVLSRSANRERERGETSRADRDARHIGAPHPAIRRQRHIARERVSPFAHEVRQIDAADFFFRFDQES